MRLNVTIDTSRMDLVLTSVQKNLAFSTAQALNDVASDLRAEGRKQISQITKKVRIKKGEYGPSQFEQAGGDSMNKDEAAYLKKRFCILARANVKRGRIFAIVGWRDLKKIMIGDFEQAAKIAGDETLFLSQVGRKFVTLRDLNLRMVQVTPRKRPDAKQLKGDQRTLGLFSTKTFPKGGIFQRTGPGRGDLRLLFSYAAYQRERIVQRLMDLPGMARKMYAEKFRIYFERRFAGLTKSGKGKRAA